MEIFSYKFKENSFSKLVLIVTMATSGKNRKCLQGQGKICSLFLTLILLVITVVNNTIQVNHQLTTERTTSVSRQHHVYVIQSVITQHLKTQFKLAPRLTIKPSKQTQLLLLHLILLQAGDLETNPGPPKKCSTGKGRKCKSKEPEFPCALCSEEVTWTADALQCEGCDYWLHKECMNMSDDEYARLGGLTSVWICSECGLMNISASLFRVPANISDNSRFSVLANQGHIDQSYDTICSMTSDTSPGKPLHTSSPAKKLLCHLLKRDYVQK